MSMRIDDAHPSPPDDDWFASSEAPTTGREDLPLGSDDAYDREPEWEAADQWEHDDPASRDVAHRHLGIVLAVLVAVFLVFAGFLVGRITKDSTETVVTMTSTVEAAPTTPAETTPTETTPTETTPTETTPTETTPTDTTPAETTPAETTPAETTPAETTPAVTTPATPPTSVPTDETLRPGTKGSQSVATLQAALTSLGYAAGTPDGSYGPATVAAASAFQTAVGLSADGVAGPATLAAINAALAKG
ncbi:peptidoglycan-binding domain-containing protein [Gaiella sp.]|uniref:peptidoglycan-binding domain-containing protein n=1 Tax=Gaiella sp. TaxID=2663207 RepID=UPI0039833F2E